MSIIRVENLKKSIKGKVILEDLSFAVERGDCLALIGPNGAGKTTLMNCLLGDRKVTSGIIEVEEKAPGHPRLKASVSYLPQENAIVQKLTVQELINFFRSIYPNPVTGEEIDDLLRFSSEQKKQLASKLSGGQKRLLSFVFGRANCWNGYFHPPTLLGDRRAFKGRRRDHCLFFALHRGSRTYS